jgi:hypothetical protein
MSEVILTQVRALQQVLAEIERHLPRLVARGGDETKLSLSVARANDVVAGAWARLLDHAGED